MDVSKHHKQNRSRFPRDMTTGTDDPGSGHRQFNSIEDSQQPNITFSLHSLIRETYCLQLENKFSDREKTHSSRTTPLQPNG